MKRLIFDPLRDFIVFIFRGIKHVVVFSFMFVTMWSMVKLGFPAVSAYLPTYPRVRSRNNETTPPTDCPKDIDAV